MVNKHSIRGFEMFQVIGVDIGYGFVKITDGIKGYSFPSVIGDGNVDPTYSIEGNTVIPINDLKIKINGKLYFVGKMHCDILLIYTETFRSRGLLRTTLRYCISQPLAFSVQNSTNSFKVVTGLPVDRMHMAGELKERIGGEKALQLVETMNSMVKGSSLMTCDCTAAAGHILVRILG